MLIKKQCRKAQESSLGNAPDLPEHLGESTAEVQRGRQGRRRQPGPWAALGQSRLASPVAEAVEVADRAVGLAGDELLGSLLSSAAERADLLLILSFSVLFLKKKALPGPGVKAAPSVFRKFL